MISAPARTRASTVTSDRDPGRRHGPPDNGVQCGPGTVTVSTDSADSLAAWTQQLHCRALKLPRPCGASQSHGCRICQVASGW